MVRGLKGQPNDKEKRFFNIIQAEAEKQGCIFFAEAGEGHELETDDLFCEDFSGWLIKKNDAARFEQLWNVDNSWKILGEWESSSVMAEWVQNDDGQIRISFAKY